MGLNQNTRPSACQGCPLQASHAGRPSSPGLENEGWGLSQEAAQHCTHTFLTHCTSHQQSIGFVFLSSNDADDSVLLPGPQEVEMGHCQDGERASPRVGEEGKGMVGPFQGQGKEQPHKSWAWSPSSLALTPLNRSHQREPRTSKTLSSDLFLFLS